MEEQRPPLVGGDSVQVSIGSGASNVAAGKDIRIFALPDRLPPSEERSQPASRFDWLTYTLIGIFGLFCLAAIIGPILLFEYSSRAPGMGEVQNWMLTLSSVMSGVIGLLGVLVGYRIRGAR